MIERLKIILEYYNLSASHFAERIDVPRSSISHLLSGRNKPSLDFIIKVEKAFDEVNLDWLIYGKGNFPKDKEAPSLFDEPAKKPVAENIISETIQTTFSKNDQKKLVKIILLYDDQTFDVFNK